jgi:hypothetical protein
LALAEGRSGVADLLRHHAALVTPKQSSPPPKAAQTPPGATQAGPAASPDYLSDVTEDERRIAALVQVPLGLEDELVSRNLSRLQQYTLAEYVERNPARVVVVRAEVQALLASEFGLEVTNKDEAENQIRNLGLQLCANGGNARMLLVAHQDIAAKQEPQPLP